MKIKEHLDKNNLHHAYLIEGAREQSVKEVLEFVKSLGIETNANADVCRIELDSFKIDDARNLKSLAVERGFTSLRKIFIISANSFLLEAQNSLLKMFEEPIENTHFFIITPDASALLKTLVSRFYFISAESNLIEELKEAEKFIKMPISKRINFIKELLVEEEEDEEGNEILALDSVRSKALKFLNALEVTLHGKLVKNFSGLLHLSAGTPPARVGFPVQNSLPTCLEHFFKVRKFLRMPGSSAKTLMESVALVIPEK